MADARDDSEIAAFYSGKCVLVTGGTGFLGLVLVEKLLRSCPDLRTLYLLVRDSARTGLQAEQRLDELFADVLFDELRKREPQFRRRVVAVRGDVSREDLGLGPEQRRLLQQQVHVVFHAAATVRFDERLRVAAHINVRGTRSLLQLAGQCVQLQAFVHVSTAYSCCPRRHIAEQLYAAPLTPEQLLQLADTAPDPGCASLAGHPNTYTLTKQVAEQAVAEQAASLPVCIFRPSIVLATYREPLRGWSNSVYGPTGVLVGVGTGVLRTLHGDPDAVADLVPVDMCAAALLACAWETASRGPRPLPTVYNYVSSPRNPITWGRFIEMNKRHGMRWPTVRSVWYYSFRLVRRRWQHELYTWLLHLAPALLVDACLAASGRRPRMLRLYRKIHRFGSVLAYFTLRQWRWEDGHAAALWRRLGPDDRRLFPFDLETRLDWEEHASTQLLGLRLYFVKDDLSTVPAARRRWRRLRLLHAALQAAALLLLLALLYSLTTNFIQYYYSTF